MISRLTVLFTAAFLAAASLASALELKDITYTTKDAGKVVFSHKTHLQKKSKKNPNFNCKSCHSSAAGKNTHYTMADMEKGKSCGKCHNGSKAFAVAKCTQCHKVRDIAYNVKETGPVLFSHTRHLKSRQCSACHNKLFQPGPNPKTTMASMAKGKGCGACHNGKTAFAVANCVKCHPVHDITYKVASTGNVKFSHTFHIDAYRCEECHTKIYRPARDNKKVSMAEMEKGKSCGACHDGKTAFAVANCVKCHPVSDVTYKVTDAGDAKFSHTFHIGVYRCEECHTKIYRPARDNKKVSMAEMEQGKSCGACHDKSTAFTVRENCGKCHAM